MFQITLTQFQITLTPALSRITGRGSQDMLL